VKTDIAHTEQCQQIIRLDHYPANPEFREERSEKRPTDLCGAKQQEQEKDNYVADSSKGKPPLRSP
jgi:hypothetical protein